MKDADQVVVKEQSFKQLVTCIRTVLIGEKFKLDELIRMGAKGYLTKPYSVDKLSKKIKEII